MALIHSEFDLIRKIKAHQPAHSQTPLIIRGIGDDAAVFSVPDGEKTILSTDLFMEGSHFKKEFSTPYDIGYKAMSANLSDLAAMGATPRYAFISIAIPRTWHENDVLDIYRGIKELSEEFEVALLGGDTTVAPHQMALNIAIVGSAPEKNILYRSTAQPGDFICTTKPLGDSWGGLHLFLEDMDLLSSFPALKKQHLRPTPDVREGLFLAHTGLVTACMDISDGLSSDVNHLAQESQVGIHLYEDKLPASGELCQYATQKKYSITSIMLTGGEEFSLLFTVAPDHVEALQRKYTETFQKEFWILGNTTSTPTDRLLTQRNGSVISFENTGWDHFTHT